MKKIHTYYLITSLVSLFCGITFFVVYQELIVIRCSTKNLSKHDPIYKQHATKKTITIHYWHAGEWKTETENIIWSNDKTHNLKTVVTNWLNLLDEEQITEKKISLQTAILMPSEHDAYLSFDNNPLPQEKATIQKLMLIEGLLKTIRENEIPIQTIQLLVHHQPVQDYHLDFSNPWPICGFVETNTPNNI
jgi:hypothetical protein